MIHDFIGLALGLAADATVLYKHLKGHFALLYGIITVLFTFYSLLICGFFMVFPVFNAFVGNSGFYLVARTALSRVSSRRYMKEARNHLPKAGICQHWQGKWSTKGVSCLPVKIVQEMFIGEKVRYVAKDETGIDWVIDQHDTQTILSDAACFPVNQDNAHVIRE